MSWNSIWRSVLCGTAAALVLSPSPAFAGAKLEISDESFITLGAGLRINYTAEEDSAPSGSDYSKDIELESFRLYIGGQFLEYVSFEFNADYDGDESSNDLQVLDGVIKFEFSDQLNIWAGRFLPPTDRSNFSGPYYLNSWDFPFVHTYDALFAGRQEGVAYWGQAGGGMFKWQVGAFEGRDGRFKADDELLFTGRLTLNLLDPEPGYYNASTYYGDKDILAFGLVGYHQADVEDDFVAATATTPASGPTDRGNFTAWNVDFLFEKKLADTSVVSLEGAYYDYDRDNFGTPSNEGEGYFALASYLLPFEVGPGSWRGRFQPFVRYQEFDPDASGFDDHDRLDMGLTYVLRGHNARITLQYSLDDSGALSSEKSIFRLGLQFQI